jgi:hypothetical protein
MQTAASAHSGGIVTAGPASLNGRFGPGGGPGGPGGQFRGGGQFPGGPPPQGQGFPGAGNGFPGLAPGGATPGALGQGGNGPGGFQPGAGAAGGRGGMGGLLNAGTPSAALRAALTANADKYTWVLATVGANNAAGYQLAVQKPVMAIGGFNGSDDAPSLEQFQQWVKQGRVHYFLGGGGFGGQAGGSRVASAIASWVSANFTAKTVGGVTLYDLTAAK